MSYTTSPGSQPNYGAVEDARPPHQCVTVSSDRRMQLNGESKEQMEHVEAIKAAGGVSPNKMDGNDTSKDQDWEYDLSSRAKATDWYVFATTILWLGIKLPVFAIPMLLAHVPAFTITRLYISSIPDGTERVRRTKMFYFAFWMAAFLSLPAAVLIVLSLFLDYAVYYIFSLAYCLCTCRWVAAMKSQRSIDPYRNGPSIIRHLTDFFVCCMGQCARQSFGETLYMVSCMWLLMPWLKYYICCNPWVYDLDHRLCQQISTSMKDLGAPSEVADTCRGVISRARQLRSVANRLHIWSFVPHYPYPPPDRRWAIGLQAGGSNFPGKFTLMVHTTHAVSSGGHSTEQFVLSNCCAEPIYRVMLWYSNPYHFLTGWVEASVSTGHPSQPDKFHGGEHPMWLVAGRSPLVAGRDSFTGSGMIDAFFDYWLPVFVHEMRRLTYSRRFAGEPDCEEKAVQVANKYYQEVYSEDGVSRPRSFVGREKYEGQDTLSKFQKIAEGKVHKHIAQEVDEVLGGIAETDLGKKMCEYQQDDEDLHAAGGLLEGR